MNFPASGKKFSFSCMNFYYFNDDGKIIKDVAAQGNTESVAGFIQNAVGGDLFEIDTVKDYPIDYTEGSGLAAV